MGYPWPWIVFLAQKIIQIMMATLTILFDIMNVLKQSLNAHLNDIWKQNKSYFTKNHNFHVYSWIFVLVGPILAHCKANWPLNIYKLRW